MNKYYMYSRNLHLKEIQNEIKYKGSFKLGKASEEKHKLFQNYVLFQ